jgi:hypothetical protein
MDLVAYSTFFTIAVAAYWFAAPLLVFFITGLTFRVFRTRDLSAPLQPLCAKLI